MRKALGTYDLTLIGVSSTLGAGIFVLTGPITSNVAGPAVFVSFLIAGLASVFSALCYCELSSRYPKSGSAYSYVMIVMNRGVAFFVGWNMLLEYVFGAAAVTRSLTSFCVGFFGAHWPLTLKIDCTTESHFSFLCNFNGNDKKNVIYNLDIYAMLTILIVTVVMYAGIKKFSLVNSIGTLGTLFSLFLIIVGGVFYVDFKNWTNLESFFPFGVKGILSGASSCFFSYVGFDVIASMGEEAVNSKRTLPVSMLLSCVICSVIYISSSAILTLMVDYRLVNSEQAFSIAFRSNHASVIFERLIDAGTFTGLFSATLTGLLPLPRIMYAMAQDGFLFKVFEIIDEKTNLPNVGVVTAGLLTSLVAFFVSIEDLIQMMSIGTLFAYSCVSLCVLFIRVEKISNSSIRFTCLVSIIYILVNCVVISVVFVYLKFSFENNFLNLTMFVFLLTNTIVLFSLKWMFNKYEHKEDKICDTFTTPMVPFVPVLSLFINSVLLVSFNKMCLLRFLVWNIFGCVFWLFSKL